MAMHVPQTGFSSMLKEGARHFSGLEEACYRNIQACTDLAKILRTSYGPNGMNKMVINHLEKLFVTNDAATIIRELEVQHPAAKMLVMAAQMQEQECGDGTNFVLILAGTLLEKAEDLLRMGVSVPEVVEGYELAAEKVLEILPSLECGKAENLRDLDSVAKAIKTSVASMQYGYEDFLSRLIAEACVTIIPETNFFNVDNVRVCKILGCGLLQSTVMRGIVFRRVVEGDIASADNAKIAVYNCPFDFMQTEVKGTVLIKSAKELLQYSEGEENFLEAQVKAIRATGCNVIVSQGKPGDIAMHFANKHKLMVVRIMSKFDMRRMCQATGATALPKMGVPTTEELGFCSSVYTAEIGETPLIVFRQDRQENAIATIIVRGSTDNIMDDIERAIDDGVNTFKALTRDNRFVPGAGATEIELALKLSHYATTVAGLQQYAIKQYAEALEAIPRALASNCGVKANDLVVKMYTAHEQGQQAAGIDVEGDGVTLMDASKAGVLDLLVSRRTAIKLATDAATTVLRVDQIIMAKAAGGPKVPKAKGDWDDE